MKRDLNLHYDLGEGWLEPWLQALRTGKALASACKACGDVHFPPLRTCPSCRTRCNEWRTLGGGARIVFRTKGADGDYALAQFDGASSAAVASTAELPSGAKRAILAPCPNDPPTITLIAEPER
jgi:hypothetical protein